MTLPISEQQKHITSLFEQRAQGGGYAETVANTLERDISTALKGDQKYIFEMLQNADDAGVEQQEVKVRFQLIHDQNEKYLLISHNGAQFTSSDVEKITDYAQQKYTDKATNQDVIGYKGVGFKAIFSIADCVTIISNGYQFRFDKHYPKWKTRDGKRYPWPVIPIWTEDDEIPKSVRGFLDKGNVNFVVQLNPDIKIENDLQFFIRNPEIMLFLRRVREICIASEKVRVFQLRQEEGGYKLYENEQLKSFWRKYNVDILIDARRRQLLNALNAHECPERLKTATKSQLVFALKLDEKHNIVPVYHSVLYAGLPTQVNLGGLPFVVSGDFLLDPSRAHLQDNGWNEWLIQQMAARQFQWFASLNSEEAIRFQILKLFRVRPTIATPKITQAFERGFQQGVKEVPFLPSFQDPQRLIKKPSAQFDETGFFDQFKEVAFPENLLDRRLQNHRVLQVRAITSQMLCEVLPKLVSNHTTPAFQLRLFEFFKQRNQSFHQFLPNTPIILDSSNQWRLPREIYFSSKEAETIPKEIPINLVHPELAEQTEFRTWALQLGAQHMGTREIILGKIPELIATHRITIHNVLPIARFIFEAFKSGKLHRNDFFYLTNLPILTTSGSLKNAREVYLSDVYKPNFSLQQILSQNEGIFVSEEYDAKGAEREDWRDFLLLLGVQQGILFKIKDFQYSIGEGKKEKGSLFADYLNHLQRQGMTAQTIRDKHYFTNFFDCNLLTLKSVGIAKAFWNQLLHHWTTFTNRPMMQYCMANGQRKNVTVSFVEYVLQNTRCVPASDGSLRFPREVYYQHSPFSSIVSVDLPEALTKEQAQYFQFKTTLTCQECIEFLLDLNKRKVKDVEAYRDILIILLEMPSSTVKSAIGGRKILLPSQCGELESTTELRCFAVSDRKPPLSLYTKQWLKEFPGLSQELHNQIANLFGVRVIIKEDAVFSFESPLNEDPEGKQFLMSRLSLIARVEALISSGKEEQLLSKFKDILEPIHIKRTNRMTFSYRGLRDVEEPVFAYLQGKSLYTRFRWDNESTIDHFCKVLAKHLTLSKQTSKHLRGILKAHSMEEWLKDHQLAEEPLLEVDSVLSLVEEPDNNSDQTAQPPSSAFITEEKKTEPSMKQESPSTPEKNLTITPRQLRMKDIEIKKLTFTPKNTASKNLKKEKKSSPPELTISPPPSLKKSHSPVVTITPPTQDIGQWGEEVAFLWLKHYYQEKYPGMQYEETNCSFRLKRPDPDPFHLQVTWLNPGHESEKSYDLEVWKNRLKKVKEVKTALSRDKKEFSMGQKEYKKMFKYREKYEFLHVTGAGTENPKIRRIKNPAEKIENNEITVKAYTIQL